MTFRLSFIAIALAATPIYASAAETAILDAEEITVNDATGVISAKGRVEARAEGRVLSGDELTYNRDNATLSVPRGVSFKEADGSVLRADSVVIDNELQAGIFQNLSLESAGMRMRSRTARRDNMQLSLEGAVMTSCPACENPDSAPLWQIRAAKIHYDRAGQNVDYRHSRLEVFGLPVFYLPFMAHAGPEVDRRSGVLTPAIGNDSNFGGYVETPYFMELAPNYDLTLTPRFSAEQDPFMKMEWRHLTSHGQYQATGYVHQPSDILAEDSTRDIRGGLLAKGDFTFGPWNYLFDIQNASDNLFFKQYKIFNPARLTSSLAMKRSFGRHRLELAAYRFDSTTETETVSALLPRITHNYSAKNRVWGGRLSWRNIFTKQQRDNDIDTAHINSLIDWSWRHISSGGFVWSAQNRLSIDAYDFTVEDDDPAREEAEAAEKVLTANSLALGLAYPLVRETAFDRQTLSPQIQLVLAEADAGYDDIPFIGTATRNLTQAQLFKPLAAKDEANRVNLGIAHELEFSDRLGTKLFLGQSFNLSDENHSETSGYDHDGNDRSALLANSAIYAGPLSLSHEARFSDDGGALLRGETRMKLAFKDFDFEVDHSFYEAGQQSTDSAVLEEATGRLGWQMGQNWRLDASLRENLESRERVRAEAAFSYEDDCTLASITIDRDYSRTGAIEPDTSINFTFTLKTLGN